MGLSVYFIGSLFKIQHWPGASLLIIVAIVLLLAFFSMVLLEVTTSRKAESSMKARGVLYAVACLAILLLVRGILPMFLMLGLGLYYKRLRKQYLFSKSDRHKITFDSI
jgi:H+/Cl- antiporter ClcA